MDSKTPKPPMPKHFVNIGEQLNAMMGEFVTLGRFDLLNGLLRIIQEVACWSILPILRFRFGTNAFGLYTILWVFIFLGLLTSIDALFGHISRIPFLGFEYHVKIIPLKLHRFWWFWLVLFHYVHMNWEVKKRGVKRYSLSAGRSWLAILAGYIPVDRLVARFPQAESWLWKLTSEHYIQRFIEPALVVLAGLLFRSSGFAFYGGFLIVCGVALYLKAQGEVNESWKVLQSQIDAELLSEMVLADSEKSVAQKTGYVMRRKTLNAMQQQYQRTQRAGVQGNLTFAGAVDTSAMPNGNGHRGYGHHAVSTGGNGPHGNGHATNGQSTQ